MTTKPQRSPIFRWTNLKNLLAILLFASISILLEYIAVSFAVSTGIKDPTGITLTNVTFSPLYFLVPAAVVIALTASFIHLTTNILTLKRKSETKRKQQVRRTIRKKSRLDSVRRFSGRISQTTRRIRTKIRKTWGIRQVADRIDSAKSVIGCASTIIVTFTALVILVTAAAYPKLVPSTTADFFHGNPVFLNFVTSTIRASEGISNAIPPVGAIATSIHNALTTVAPGFRDTLVTFLYPLSNGLASLSPIAKFLLAQNTAAWSVAVVAIFYRYYVRRRSYSR
ncbi:MAG: hypothetical protein NWF11_06540 [Candidatus Bathyarchaeota archaeon]|nr:hypothetical protein [Candidatus Bathyarchaeota archaeon]